MLKHVARKGRGRKLRLFAVACCRRAWERIPDETCRRAVEVAERFADGQASHQERREVERAAAGLCDPRVIDYRYLAYHVIAGMRYSYHMASSVAEVANWVVTGRPGSEGPEALAESAAQCGLLREVFGNPFRPVVLASAWLAWNDGTIPKLAQAIYDERAFERLPVLADALEEAGCTGPDLLGHCRQPAEHARGCWAVDFLLGKS
ncbi:MAG TPA: hypothetical protein VFE78_19540 [Gemmataceae bacterium]|nr:hypothetical protein [Gemmataceae bacterium]